MLVPISHNAQRPIREIGVPIWAVISMTPDGDTMRMALMLRTQSND
jgi:hypothetical protein